MKIKLNRQWEAINPGHCVVTDITFDSRWVLKEGRDHSRAVLPLQNHSALKKEITARKIALQKEIDSAMGSGYQEQYTQFWERDADLRALLQVEASLH